MEITAHSHYDNEYIYLSLLYLGAVTWNKSSQRLMLALQYGVSHKSLIDGSIKYLYNELASSQKCTYRVIEHSLRYAINRLWECSHSECSKLLYHSKDAPHCPSVSEFICLYSAAFKMGIIQAWVDSLEKQNESSEKIDINDILDMF